jgi:hypothetical protein
VAEAVPCAVLHRIAAVPLLATVLFAVVERIEVPTAAVVVPRGVA